MSAIDSTNHAHCANLILSTLKVPIYWVFSNDYEHESGEKVAINDLLLGGGSGEHPSLLIKNIDILCLNYIFSKIDEEDINNYKEIEERLELLIQKILINRSVSEKEKEYYLNNRDFIFLISHENYINLNDWPISSLHKIEEEYIKSSVDKKLYRSAENYLLSGIAQYVIDNLPKQAFDDEILKEIQIYKNMIENNLILNIENPNNYMGKTIKNNAVVWGYSLNDYKEDQKIYDEKKLLSEIIMSDNSKMKINKI